MKKRTLFAGIPAAAAVMGLSMSAAFAFQGTQVSVDGDTTPGTVAVGGFNDGGLNFLTDWGTPMDCDDAEVVGTLHRGAAVVEDGVIGTIDDLLFKNCSATGLGYQVEVTSDPGSWNIVATETPANPGDPVEIEIRDVSAYMHSTGSTPWPCELEAKATAITGTFYPGVTADGNDGRIETSTSGFPLAITAFTGAGTRTPNPPNVGTCGGQIYTDDAANMFGDFEMNIDSNDPGGNPISHQ